MDIDLTEVLGCGIVVEPAQRRQHDRFPVHLAMGKHDPKSCIRPRRALRKARRHRFAMLVASPGRAMRVHERAAHGHAAFALRVLERSKNRGGVDDRAVRWRCAADDRRSRAPILAGAPRPRQRRSASTPAERRSKNSGSLRAASRPRRFHRNRDTRANSNPRR